MDLFSKSTVAFHWKSFRNESVFFNGNRFIFNEEVTVCFGKLSQKTETKKTSQRKESEIEREGGGRNGANEWKRNEIELRGINVLK